MNATNAATSSPVPYLPSAVIAVWGVAQSPAAGFKFRVNRARLNIIDRDAAASELSQQTLVNILIAPLVAE